MGAIDGELLEIEVEPVVTMAAGDGQERMRHRRATTRARQGGVEGAHPLVLGDGGHHLDAARAHAVDDLVIAGTGIGLDRRVARDRVPERTRNADHVGVGDR